MELQIFQIIIYTIACAALFFYLILDGFDLGVGILHLFAKGDKERRIFLNAIGPVWDGNEVWLVIIGGVLFAGFPDVFGTLFSGFYTPVMILLAGLIFRAVSIEVRSKHPSPKWRSIWDIVFAVASILIAAAVGAVLGNLVVGLPVNEDGHFTLSIFRFFGPYQLLLGVTAVALFAMHGAVYLLMKTEDELQEKLKNWVKPAIIAFLALYLVLTVATIAFFPEMVATMNKYKFFYIVPVLGFVALLNVANMVAKERFGRAFISSCIAILFLVAVYVIGTFPVLIRSTISPEYSLTIFNSSSQILTLKYLTLIAAIGVPLVIAYGTYIYRTFRGKVVLTEHSY